MDGLGCHHWFIFGFAARGLHHWEKLILCSVFNEFIGLKMLSASITDTIERGLCNVCAIG